jgi:hypothetical protein
MAILLSLNIDYADFYDFSVIFYNLIDTNWRYFDNIFLSDKRKL